MFLRGLFSFRAYAEVACEVRACLNLFIEGKQRLPGPEIVTTIPVFG
jgi:hypothetical protein